MSTLQVALGERSYPIFIQPGLLHEAQSFAPFIKGSKAVIVTNDVVSPIYLETLLDTLKGIDTHVITLPDGEQYKDLKHFELVITRLLELNASRDTTLLALGGGVIGDVTGFVAASFQRGMPFIQVPTTLLAQVDSSVGGKTAVNHPKGKNMIGAFYQPQAVIIDTSTLKTLPAREFSAGMAEVIKYGVIYDGSFFSWIEQNVSALKAQSDKQIQFAIQRCCEIKAEIVSQDERESGLRALLNLGHTFGHAIEAEQGYGVWLHGEAVAAGIALAADVAVRKGWLTEKDKQRIDNLLSAFDLPISAPQNMGYSEFIGHMQHDKKVQLGKIRFIIPKSIGSAVITQDVDQHLLEDILG